MVSSAATWTDLEVIRVSEAGQTEQDKYRMIPLPCGSYNVVQVSVFMKQRQSRRSRKLTNGHQAGGGAGSLGLTYTDYYVQNKEVIRAYCVAQGTVPNIL